MVDLSPAVAAAQLEEEFAVICCSVEQVRSIVLSAMEQFPSMRIEITDEGIENCIDDVSGEVAISVGAYRRNELTYGIRSTYADHTPWGYYKIVDYEDLDELFEEEVEESDQSLDFLFV